MQNNLLNPLLHRHETEIGVGTRDDVVSLGRARRRVLQMNISVALQSERMIGSLRLRTELRDSPSAVVGALDARRYIHVCEIS